MKKLVCLILVLLFAGVVVSCAGITPKLVELGGKIGDMTVEKSSASQRYPSIWAYCDPGTESLMEPYTRTIDCEVPLTPGIKIEFGWGAKDENILASNLEAMVWELYIDGHQINLEVLEPSRQTWSTGPARNWALALVNPTPGKHILRLLWKTETPVDDGLGVYPAGTYEDIVNFTVAEK